MNIFGEMADDLTDMIERLEQPGVVGETGRLTIALQGAFRQACLAERSMRLAQAAAPGDTAKPQSRAA